jgi:hypothetical protein
MVSAMDATALTALHRRSPWRVHDLASDFRLLDMWRIPIGAEPGGDTFQRFFRVFLDNGIQTGSPAADALFRLRFLLGKWFRWDEPRPIPGDTRASVAERLTTEDRVANRIGSVVAQRQPVPVHPIYLFDDEALVEITNRTIHALLHLSLVAAAEGRKDAAIAVYIKSRGVLSDVYMAMIGPFRHWIVYPAWIHQLTVQWRRSERT